MGLIPGSHFAQAISLAVPSSQSHQERGLAGYFFDLICTEHLKELFPLTQHQLVLLQVSIVRWLDLFRASGEIIPPHTVPPVQIRSETTQKLPVHSLAAGFLEEFAFSRLQWLFSRVDMTSWR